MHPNIIDKAKSIRKGLIHPKIIFSAAGAFVLGTQMGCHSLSSRMISSDRPGTSFFSRNFGKPPLFPKPKKDTRSIGTQTDPIICCCKAYESASGSTGPMPLSPMSDAGSHSTSGDSGYAPVSPNVTQLHSLNVHGISGSVSPHTSPPPPPPPPPLLLFSKGTKGAPKGQGLLAQLQAQQAQLHASKPRSRSLPQSSGTSNDIYKLKKNDVMDELSEKLASRKARQDFQSSSGSSIGESTGPMSLSSMSDSESNSTDGDSGYARVFPNVVQLSALDVHGVSGSVSHHTSPPPPPPPLPPSLFTRKVANSASVGQKFQAQLQYRHIPQAQLNKSQSRYRSRPQSSDTSNRIMNELNENKLFAKRRASQDVQS